MNRTLGKLEDKHIAAFTVLGLIAIIYLFYTFVFVPQSAQIELLSIQCQQEQQKLKTIEAFQTAHPNIEEYLQELDNKKIAADTMLPDEPEMRGFLVQAETAAKGNIPLLRVKYSPVANKNGYREIPVEMAVSGNYFQTLSFIKNIEESPRFNSIKNVVMKLNKGTIETTITSSIFVYGVPAADKTPGKGQTNKK